MLRHATGYALANKGTDTRTLQAYPGHRSIQSTVRYTELAPGAVYESVAMTAELLPSSLVSRSTLSAGDPVRCPLLAQSRPKWCVAANAATCQQPTLHAWFEMKEAAN